jgi:hypothetical protein
VDSTCIYVHSNNQLKEKASVETKAKQVAGGTRVESFLEVEASR